MKNVVVAMGAGQVGQAIARRVNVGKHVLADMRSGKRGAVSLASRMFLATALVVACTMAHAEPARDVIEKYGLLGSFALDCSKPASADNHYIVHRAMDGGFAQRDLMVGPTTRQYGYIIDQASASSPTDVAVSMGLEGRRLDMVLRIEGKRMRTMESGPPNGAKIITAGRFVNGGDTPWYSKCTQ